MQVECLWCLLLLMLLSGCAEQERASSGEPTPSAMPATPLAFVDVATEAGLGAFEHIDGSEDRFWFPEKMGAGGGFVDINGDGWHDVVLVGGGQLSPSGPADVRALWLFLNNKDGQFTDVTEAWGLADVRAYGTGITAADYDNDGDQDIYLTAFGKNLLFRNEGTRFEEVGEAAGVALPAAWSSSALFFDADRDGYVDLYVPGYAEWSLETDIDCHRSGGRPDYCPPATYPSAQSYFYHNNGDGTFSEETAQRGFADAPGKALAVAEWDFNRDGWSDVMVVNDGQPDLLYHNNGDGTFTERGTVSGIAFGEHGEARAGMGIDIGVVDSTGRPSVFVGNFSSEMVGVYRQMESGWFVDRAAASRIGGASLTTLAFGVLLFDADLDTDLDLYVANGHVYLDPLDGSAYRQPPHLFINQGNGTFKDMADTIGGVLTQPMLARGVASADYDRDGDVDLLVTENSGPVHLLRNDSQRGRVVRVRLSQPAHNPDALGAHVWAVVQGAEPQQRRVRTGSGYLSQSEQVLTFGLGTATHIDSLVVQWPDGQVDRFEGLPAEHEIHLRKGAGTVDQTPLPVRRLPATDS